MKLFEAPSVEVVKFTVEDVITTSGFATVDEANFCL